MAAEGWHKLEEFTKYKAYRSGKAVFKVSAHYSSQECADCGHIHPDNRKSQELFKCDSCGHTDNADRNATLVLKKRAIKLILDSGTELSKRGVLLDSGRGAKIRREKRKATHSVAKNRQKRQENSLELLLTIADINLSIASEKLSCCTTIALVSYPLSHRLKWDVILRILTCRRLLLIVAIVFI